MYYYDLPAPLIFFFKKKRKKKINFIFGVFFSNIREMAVASTDLIPAFLCCPPAFSGDTSP
jgi:hypothetical protein